MFQYALGRRLAIDHAVSLKLDIRAFATDPLRDYRLDNFKIQAQIAEEHELEDWLQPNKSIFQHFLRMLPGRRTSVVRETGLDFNSEAVECERNSYLHGYWQSERYFSSIANVIRDEFALANPMSTVRREIAEQMYNSNAISLHVRRGDYVADAKVMAFHGVCSKGWYENAVSVMADRIKLPTFFVFSDDPEWVRSNLSIPWRTVYVDPQSDGKDFEDMHLMANCKHHIIANSTFSWWGAWLNPSLSKQVIAPKRWFNQGPSSTPDLIPASWIRL